MGRAGVYPHLLSRRCMATIKKFNDCISNCRTLVALRSAIQSQADPSVSGSELEMIGKPSVYRQESCVAAPPLAQSNTGSPLM